VLFCYKKKSSLILRCASVLNPAFSVAPIESPRCYGGPSLWRPTVLSHRAYTQSNSLGATSIRPVMVTRPGATSPLSPSRRPAKSLHIYFLLLVFFSVCTCYVLPSGVIIIIKNNNNNNNNKMVKQVIAPPAQMAVRLAADLRPSADRSAVRT